MIKRLKSFLKIQGFAWRMLRHGGGKRVEFMLEEDAARAIILDSLIKQLHIETTEQRLNAHSAAERIATEIFSLRSGKHLQDRILLLLPAHLANQYYLYSQACAIACVWELNIRQLADLVGVEIYNKGDDKKKKNKVNKLIDFRKLEYIIDDLKQTYPKINIRYTELMNLRGALLHGNLHEARGLVNMDRPKKKQKEFSGNVLMLELDTGESKFIDNEELPEKIGVFGWGLEILSSDLMFEIISIFESSTLDVGQLAKLKSLSFKEADGSFDRIFRDGTDLEAELDKLKAVSARMGPTDHWAIQRDRITKLVKL